MEDGAHLTSSLRVRKKARQRAELLEAAAELFRQKGYEQTRMDDVANRAGVSTPTVYNYFATKQQILIEILREGWRETVAALGALLRNPPDDPVEALALLIRTEMGEVRSAEDKQLWREIMAATVRSHDRENDEFEGDRAAFKGCVERLLRLFIARGQLSPSLPVPIVVDIVYAIGAHDFRRLCSSETGTPENILNLARQQMRVLLAGSPGEDPRRTAAPPCGADFAPVAPRRRRRKKGS